MQNRAKIPIRSHLLLLFFLGLTLMAGCQSPENRDPEAAVLQLRVGAAELQNGAYPQAMSTLLKAESLDPENADIQNSLGQAYFVRQRYSEAEKHFRRALGLRQNFTDARNNLARLFIEMGQYTAAISELKKVEADLTYLNPERALVNLGMAYFYLKNYEDSESVLVRALNTQRDNCPAHSFLGRNYYEQKNYKKAASELDKAIAYCQKSLFDEPNYYSALSYYALGDAEKAKMRLEEMIKLFPNGLHSEKARAMLELMRK